MQSCKPRRLRAIATPILAVVAFPLLVYSSGHIAEVAKKNRGSLEVSQFITDHRQLVADRLADPKVHSFSLTHEPEHSETLLIQFDVDDRGTYRMLESDLIATNEMEYSPSRETNIRSNEDLGTSFDYPVPDVYVFLSFMGGGMMIFLFYVVTAAFILWLGCRRPEAPAEYDPSLV